MRRPTRRFQAGVSLIELMVALVVASLSVAFIFMIYTSASGAFRDQRQVGELQSTLGSARQQLASDVRMAGFLARDLTIAPDPTEGGWTGGGAPVGAAFHLNPLAVINSSTGPDLLRVAYADLNCSSRVTELQPDWVAVDDGNCFAEGDLVALVKPATGAPNVPPGRGCVVVLTAYGGPTLHFAGSASPWNAPTNPQCAGLAPPLIATRFVLRAYRIDQRGHLQLSPSGGLVPDDWETLAVGFVDLQLAVQHWEPLDAGDEDGDGDGRRDWWSGDNLGADLFAGAPPNDSTVLYTRVTLVARSSSEVDGVSTARTPELRRENPAHNDLGDRASQELTGSYILRTTTELIDMRNLGIGK